jgi:hypothetical protein
MSNLNGEEFATKESLGLPAGIRGEADRLGLLAGRDKLKTNLINRSINQGVESYDGHYIYRSKYPDRRNPNLIYLVLQQNLRRT